MIGVQCPSRAATKPPRPLSLTPLDLLSALCEAQYRVHPPQVDKQGDNPADVEGPQRGSLPERDRIRPRAGEHQARMGPRAGEHEDRTGPRAGEHEGHNGGPGLVGPIAAWDQSWWSQLMLPRQRADGCIAYHERGTCQ